VKSALTFALIVSTAAPSVSVAAQENRTPENIWSTIRWLKPGTEVTLRTSRSGSNRRYFIRADDDAITLLNVSDPSVPSDVAKLLRRKIAEHPDYFPLPTGRTIALDSRVYLSTSGVVVAGQTIAEYDRVVERIPRPDVEGGALEVEPSASIAKQILLTIGVAVAAGIALIIIECKTKGCD